MYQPASYPASFIIKQSLFAIFVAWFCCVIVLMSTNPQFFDFDYSSINNKNPIIPDEYYGVKFHFVRALLKGYDEIVFWGFYVIKICADFSNVMFNGFNDSRLITSSIVLLIPFFMGFLFLIFVASFTTPAKVVLLSAISSFLMILTVIFNVFAGFFYGYESLQTNPVQVSSEAVVNLMIFYVLLFLMSIIPVGRLRKIGD